MARSRPNRLRRPVAGHVEKALPPGLAQAGGQVRTADQISALLQHQAQRGNLATALPRDEYPYPFGPNVPLVPAPLDPTRPSGRAEPRLWEYPVSWNMPGIEAGRHVPWKTLREAATIPLIRDCIRIRKAEVLGLEWDWTLSRRAVERAQRDDPNASRLDIETQLRQQLASEIDRAVRFWECPDPGNGFTWPEWISQFLEEHLVLDALPIYPRRTLGGDLFSMEIIDGSTIKPLLDHRGGRPLPPEPAYQQILYGFPRGEFTADASDSGDGQVVIPAAYTADQLVYIRREVRAATPYGLSAVENCLFDVDTWLKRVGWVRAEYTDGVMPAGFLVNNQPGGSSWTPGQLAEYERELNDFYGGSNEARKRIRALPPGWEPADTSSDQAEKYKPEFDLFLIKLVGGHFDVTAHELGHVEARGIGGAGHAEGQDRLNERKSRIPTLHWIESIITDITRAHLGTPPELRFAFLGIDDEEEDTEQLSVTDKVQAGLITLNEGRDEEGRPRFSFAEADKPMVVTATGGLTFIEGAEERQAQQEQDQRDAAAAQLQALKDRPAPGQSGGTSKPTDSAASAAKSAEAATYHRWARKAGPSARRFELRHLDAGDLARHGVDPERVVLGKAPEPDPVWSAWGPDQELARDAAGEIRAALSGAVDVRDIAVGWLAQQRGHDSLKAADEEDPATRYLGAKIRAALMRVLIEPLRRLRASAWGEGQRASRRVLDSTDLGPDETPDEAQEQAQAAAERVADATIGRLAHVLNDHEVDDADQLAAELAGVLDDEVRAETISQDIVTSTIGTAAETNYSGHGIAQKRWIVAPDSRVCKICDANADEGPVDVGTPFASGDQDPPAHPRCRCAVMPVIPGLDLPMPRAKAAGRGQHNSLKAYWLTGEGAAKWATWTELYDHLREHVADGYAKRIAAQWFHDRYGKWPGQGHHEKR